MKITLEFLDSKDIHESQRKIFAKEWPEGMDLNGANLRRAVELGMDIRWVAETVLSPDQYLALNASAEMHIKAYDDDCTPHRDAYNDACISHEKAREDACAIDHKVFMDAREPLLKTYDDALANLLAAALNLPQDTIDSTPEAAPTQKH